MTMIAQGMLERERVIVSGLYRQVRGNTKSMELLFRGNVTEVQRRGGGR